MMFIHPRVIEQCKLQELKQIVLERNYNLPLSEILKIITCKYRSELKLILKKNL